MTQEQDDIFIKPFYCRAGNKYVLRRIIIPLIPSHEIYVEPFVGSGAIFFNKPKATINILNDLDPIVIDNLKLILKAPSDLSKYKQDLNTLEKVREFFKNEPKTIADKITKQKIQTCNGYVNKFVKNEKGLFKGSNPFSTIKNIDLYKKKLEGVKLLNKDYKYIIKKYDSPNTFFFLDPPYENTDPTFGYAQDKHTFSFIELELELHKIKGNFILTLNDSPYIRELFKDFYIFPFVAFTNNRHLDRKRNELIITNYKI